MKTGKTLKNNQDNKTIAKRKGLKHRNIRWNVESKRKVANERKGEWSTGVSP